jgi:hypothetical protein
MATSEILSGRLQICYDAARDGLEIWLGNNRDARTFEHEEGLSVWRELCTPRAR